MKQKRVPLTISLPPNLLSEVVKLTKAEAKSKSQLFRDMLRAYQQFRLEQEFYELQRYGARRAREKGILTESDVEALVFKDR